MPRHARPVDNRSRRVAVATIAVVWLAGLFTGFFAILAIAARYGCGAADTALACGNGGSVVGGVILVGVIATVTVVTVLALGRVPRRAVIIGALGLVLLAACFVGSRLLLSTV